MKREEEEKSVGGGGERRAESTRIGRGGGRRAKEVREKVKGRGGESVGGEEGGQEEERLRAPGAAAAPTKKKYSSVMFCCITGPASRTLGQLLLGGGADSAWLRPILSASAQPPRNYLCGVCVQGIVRSTAALRNYGDNNKSATVITVICKLQEAANFPFERAGEISCSSPHKQTNCFHRHDASRPARIAGQAESVPSVLSPN